MRPAGGFLLIQLSNARFDSGSGHCVCITKITHGYGALAQLVEHLTFNQVVRGSNPRCLTR